MIKSQTDRYYTTQIKGLKCEVCNRDPTVIMVASAFLWKRWVPLCELHRIEWNTNRLNL